MRQMRRNAILAAIMTAASVSAAASAQPNVLVNGDFETNPPPNFGNNIGWPITPWVLGTGNKANVVTVDGPGGYDYGDNGPESDASAPGPGIRQHYLDIANGSNDFYQSFTPQCSGEVIFGGSFSTRANSPGTASVTLREGVGLSGPIVGQTNTISLPGGHSKTDPWTLVSYTASITASTTYSFIVHMDDNMNFDNGFVKYELTCNPPDPCCPPWNTTQLANMLVYQGTNGIAAPFTLVFTPTLLFNNQMQAYIDYLDALNPSNNEIVIAFQLLDAGIDPTNPAPVPGPQIGITYFIGWVAGFGGHPVGNLHFFNLPGEAMHVNHWYQVHTFIYLQSGLTFFPSSCATNDVEVRIQVLTAAARKAAASPVLQIRMPDGRIVEKPLV